MLKTFQNAFSAGGVTLSQCPPPSVVVQISPSSVPAQMRFTSSGDRPSASMPPRRVGFAAGVSLYSATEGGGSHVSRLRSGLTSLQFFPWSFVRQSGLVGKYKLGGRA